MNGNARASFRESQSITRLSRTFSRSLSAADLAEPLLSLDATQPVGAAKELLETGGVAVLGVRRDGGMAGWVVAGDLTGGALGEHTRAFRPEDVLSENASLDTVLGAMTETDQVFIEWLGQVGAVITRRDLQKPPLRMWLFGAITVFDTNLTWAIDELFPGDTWTDHISAGRLQKATSLRAERERCGDPCRLVECLQIKDKADILVSEPLHIASLGFKSRREADRLTSDIEKLRNHLAHAQELDPEHFATATRLGSLIQSIIRAEGVHRIVAMHRESSQPR